MEKVVYKQCPQCELNYIPANEELCESCKEKAGLITPKTPPRKTHTKKSELSERIKERTGTRYILKPLGYTENPYNGDGFPETMAFAREPKSVDVGDILIAYSVFTRKLIGYYRVTSEPKFDSGGSRWPWSVKTECLSVSYSANWKNSICYLTDLANAYLNRAEKLTYRGGSTLGALNYGADRIRLDEGFAQFLISKM